jgi:hypothetical protein
VFSSFVLLFLWILRFLRRIVGGFVEEFGGAAFNHERTKKRKHEKSEWMNGHAGLLMNLNAPTLFFSPVGL